MHLLTWNTLTSYWSSSMLEVNAMVFLNLLGSLILGLILGYERSYHGRAAGMKTYGLVCLASTALVVIVGYPEYWFGSHANFRNNSQVSHVIQGIVTGIGFLGAGVIVKEGLTISGLSTAASIWTASAIGILIGVGFYFSAILLTLLSAGVMMWGYKLETWLPSHYALSVSLVFKDHFEPKEEDLEQLFLDCDYFIAKRSFDIRAANENQSWRFHIISLNKKPRYSITDVSKTLSNKEHIDNYHVAFTCNYS